MKAFDEEASQLSAVQLAMSLRDLLLDIRVVPCPVAAPPFVWSVRHANSALCVEKSVREERRESWVSINRSRPRAALKSRRTDDVETHHPHPTRVCVHDVTSVNLAQGSRISSSASFRSCAYAASAS